MVMLMIQTQTQIPLLKPTQNAQDLYSPPLPVAAAASPADPGYITKLQPHPNVPHAFSTSHPWPCPQPSI